MGMTLYPKYTWLTVWTVVGTEVGCNGYLTVRPGLILNECMEVVRVRPLVTDAGWIPSTKKGAQVYFELLVVAQVGDARRFEWNLVCFTSHSSGVGRLYTVQAKTVYVCKVII